MSHVLCGYILILFSLHSHPHPQKENLTTYHQQPDLFQKTLVKLSDSGLSYGLYANKGEIEKVNILPDFSFAGYRGGGEALPNVPVKKYLTPIPGNNKDHIQNAINEVSLLPADKNGFRGKVLLSAGVYPIDGTIRIKTGGVVLSGLGQGRGGTVLKATKRSKHTLVILGNGNYELLQDKGSETQVTSRYVPTGSIRFSVNSSTKFKIGDTIIIRKTPNEAWLRKLGMHKYGWKPEAYTIAHERVIKNIQGDRITINAPVVDPVKLEDGGAEILRIRSNRKTVFSGIENLRLTSVFENESDEQHGWYGIKLEMAENCWVKQVTVEYFGFSAVTIDKHSAFNTVEDCAMLDPKSITTGQRKYSFYIKSGSFNLIQRCYARGGRHDFVTGSRVAGPNVFLDCFATNTHSDIGPHLKWATGTLYDNVFGGDIRVRNRKGSGSGHGWAGAQTMLWACIGTSGKGITVESPPGAINWLVGGKAMGLYGDGYSEMFGEKVVPRSLYLAQLENRLGRKALLETTKPKQRTQNLYADLERWAGESKY